MRNASGRPKGSGRRGLRPRARAARDALRQQLCRRSLSARAGFHAFADALGLDAGTRDAHPVLQALLRLDYAEALRLLDGTQPETGPDNGEVAT